MYLPLSHTHAAMTDSVFNPSAVESKLYEAVKLSEMLLRQFQISKLSLLIVSIGLQGPVGFPGDHGPPGEPGAAVSATFIPSVNLIL